MNHWSDDKRKEPMVVDIDTLKERERVLFEMECEEKKTQELMAAERAKDPRAYMTFREYAEKVMEIKTRTGRETSTIAHYRDKLEDRIYPYMGDRLLTEITGDFLDDFYSFLDQPGQNKKTGGKLSSKTILEYHHVISAIMQMAVRKHLIPFNPCEDADLPVAKPPQPNFYQPEQLQVIRKAIEDEPIKWQTIIYTMMYFGLRRGECAGITLSALDLKRKILTIRSCVMYDSRNGVYEKPYPKGRSPRQQPIPDKMVEIFQRYLDWRTELKEILGDLWIESDYLFMGEYGGRINPDVITQHLNRFSLKHQKKDPNFPHLNPHAFRHAVASILVANSHDFVTTANYIGDKPNTVATRYAHVLDEAKTRAGNTMESVIFNENKAE